MPTLGWLTLSHRSTASRTVTRQARLPPNIGLSGSSASLTPHLAACSTIAETRSATIDRLGSIPFVPTSGPPVTIVRTGAPSAAAMSIDARKSSIIARSVGSASGPVRKGVLHRPTTCIPAARTRSPSSIARVPISRRQKTIPPKPRSAQASMTRSGVQPAP